MPGTVSNPRDLVMEQLAELLFVERLLTFEVLPSLIEAVENQELKAGLARHLEQTREHVERVEGAFRSFGAEPSSALSGVFEGLKEDHEELSGNTVNPRLEDVVHASAAAASEHFEIAAYRALIELTRTLDNAEATVLLERNLRDEEEALGELEQLSSALVRAAAT